MIKKQRKVKNQRHVDRFVTSFNDIKELLRTFLYEKHLLHDAGVANRDYLITVIRILEPEKDIICQVHIVGKYAQKSMAVNYDEFVEWVSKQKIKK